MPSRSLPKFSGLKEGEDRKGQEGKLFGSGQQLTDYERSRNRSQLWISLLLLFAISSNLIYPGEIYYQSKYFLIFIALMAGLFVCICELRSPGHYDIDHHFLICFVPLLATLPSFYSTINAHRSLEVFVLFFSFACLVFYMSVVTPSQAQILLAILFLCLVALVVNFYSVYQYFLGLSKLRSLLAHTESIDPSFKSALLTRLSSGRVFGNFTLPNSLAGFVCMMLPLQLFLAYSACFSSESTCARDWRGSEALLNRIFRQPLIRITLMLQVVLSLVVLALTQSFGGWLCLLVSLTLLGGFSIRKQKISLRAIFLPASLMALVVCVWVLWISQRRGFGLLNFSVFENPIALRWLNFKVALSIFHDFPWSGVGLGNYGTINPLYQHAVVTVTQYTHNTFLQLLSECGIPFLIFGLFVTALLFRSGTLSARANQRDHGLMQISVLVSLSAWVVHNLIDIDLYFPSLGGLGVYLLALYLIMTRSSGRKGGGVPKFPPVLSRALLFVLVVSITVLGVYTVRSYFAQTLANRAIEYAEIKDFPEAEACLEQAMRLQKRDASLIFIHSNLKLKNSFDRGSLDHSTLLNLKQNYQRATELDPYNSEYHFQLSKILKALGEDEASIKEKQRAQLLFPAEPRYRH
jgi:O-antigen ligase